MQEFDTSFAVQCRKHFPALEKQHNGRPAVFFDGPAGTQVPRGVVQAMSNYLYQCNANHGGQFETSQESDRRLLAAHQAFADFVGAGDPDEIVFGQNMTSLTFAFSRSISKAWNPGDEIIVTALDHDANITPWVLAARDAGVKVHWVGFNEDDYTLNLDDFERLLSDKTRLIAVGCASNATGGINPVKQICGMAREHGALTYLDAVHYGPHGLIDVVDWGCDFLACSAYKFFGPHLGTVWGRRELLESLTPYKVRPANDQIPDRWMTGTQSHESIVGGMAAIDYLAEIGRELSGHPDQTRRAALEASFAGIRKYEKSLSRYLIEQMLTIDGIKIYGIADVDRLDQRFPTFSITHPSVSTTELARRLGGLGVYVWHGHYYALEFVEKLGLEEEGMVRIGLVHYNTAEEIDRLCQSVREVVSVALSK